MSLHFASLRTLSTKGNSREDICINGEGEIFAISVSAEGEGNQFIYKLWIFHTGCLPKIEGERAGNSVDLVEEDLARFGIEKEIDSWDTAASESPERLDCGASDIIPLFLCSSSSSVPLILNKN